MNDDAKLQIYLPGQSHDELRALVDELASGIDPSLVSISNDGDRDGLIPAVVFVYVAVGVFGTGLLTSVADWLHKRRSCLLIVDARGSDVKVTERCDLRSHAGEVILLANDGQQLRIERSSGILDLDSLLSETISKSIAAAASYARGRGLTAKIEPADPEVS